MTDIVVVSKTGDVFLDVGIPIKARLRVSSKDLIKASEYFAVLLGPHFREGQTLLNEQTVTVPTPEDDPLAMTDMCMLLHGQNVPGLLALRVPVERIYRLAVVVDKYQCAKPLAFHTEGLLFKSLSHPHHRCRKDVAFAYLTAAAFVLGVPKCFETATPCVISECDGPIQKISAGELADTIPSNVLLGLSTRHQEAYQILVDGVPKLAEQSDLDASGICDLFAVKYWPLDSQELMLLICSGAHGSTIIDLSDAIEKACNGLCLHCAKAGVSDLSTVCSVAQHKSD